MLNRNLNGYQKAHRWIYKNHGKATYCTNNSIHRTKRFEWANISKNYLFDIKDWKQLCVSCHRKYDYTEEQRIKNSIRSKGNHYRRRSIIQMTKFGEIIKKFDSIAIASNKTGIAHKAIGNCLKGRSRSSGGWGWLYE